MLIVGEEIRCTVLVPLWQFKLFPYKGKTCTRSLFLEYSFYALALFPTSLSHQQKMSKEEELGLVDGPRINFFTIQIPTNFLLVRWLQ